jgi:SAM-dependent methyltransferase
MKKALTRLRRVMRRAREIVRSRVDGGEPCGTCGFAGKPLHRDVLWPELVAQWELTSQWQRWMNQREGSRCAWCGSSLRSGQLAAAIVQAANRRSGSSASRLAALFRDPRPRALAIAEINSAGNLHRYLARCPGLRFSEFGSTAAAVPSEDLMKLSYADASFDLVITSDTLEHVPDIDIALREICRVLKPAGMHVFSVPVVWDRPTRQRATLKDGILTHLLPASHHGTPQEGKTDFLVFNEFGGDFVERCAAGGLEVELLRDAVNPALVTFIAHRSVAVLARP